MSEKNLYAFEVKDAASKPVSLEKYKGKVVLVVNVASK
ncbi:MAG: glutathione peroxidase, partial [Sphingobacteriales bacterium]